MIAEVKIGKMYVFEKIVVSAYCFQDYQDIGPCVFCEKRDGSRIVFTIHSALRNFVEVGVQTVNVDQGQIAP